MKLCLLKPQYVLRNYLDPPLKKKKTLCFLPSTHIFNSTLCTDMGFYICNVCCVNGKSISGRIRFSINQIHLDQLVAEGRHIQLQACQIGCTLTIAACFCLLFLFILLFFCESFYMHFTRQTLINPLNPAMQYSVDRLHVVTT